MKKSLKIRSLLFMLMASYGAVVSADTIYLECEVLGRQEASEERKRFSFEKENILLKIMTEDEAVSMSIRGSINYEFNMISFAQGEKTNQLGNAKIFLQNTSDKYHYRLFRRIETKSLKFSTITSVVLDRTTGELDFYEITQDFDVEKLIDRKFAGRCTKAPTPRVQF